MTFNDAELAALESGMQRIAVFFRMETDPIIRIWLGAGNIESGVNVLDTGGAEYKGFGAIQNVPALKQLLNGSAERVEFGISGVSGEVLSIASGDDATQVKGKSVTVGFALMGPDWSLLGEVHWCAFYTADFLSLQQTPSSDPNQIIRGLTLSCGTRFTARRRPGLSYFDDPDQVARHPGDEFCSLANTYAHNFSIPWPRY